MEALTVLFGLIFISVALWVILVFVSKLVALLLSRVMGASFKFRVVGCNSLRDVILTMKKGGIESICVGEIKLSFRKTLISLSKHPKLHIVICDLHIVTRSSSKSNQKTRSKKSRGSGKGKGKMMVFAKMTRFLSISMSGLVLKTPKASLDIKEVRLDISKAHGSGAGLFAKMQIFPVNVYLSESQLPLDQLSNSSGSFSSNQSSTGDCPPFNCEEFALLCEIGHNREEGLIVRSLDITTGEVRINVNEGLLLKEKGSSDTSTHLASEVVPATQSEATNKPREKQPLSAVLLKFTSMFPKKASFILPKIGVKVAHRVHGLLIENEIMGTQLNFMKSQSVEVGGDTVRLYAQLEFSEIHLLRELSISIAEIQSLDVVSSISVPLQPNSPIRSEVEIRLGETQCNLTLHRLEQWMHFRPPPKPKKQPSEGKSSKEGPRPAELKAIMWKCDLSAPEITVVLYSLSGSPHIHGCLRASHFNASDAANSGRKLHLELGKLSLNMSEKDHEWLQESSFHMETNTGSLLQIDKVSLDLGQKDSDKPEDISKMVLGADVAGVGAHLTCNRIEAFISTALFLKGLMKKLSASSKKPAQSKSTGLSKPSGKGIQLLTFKLQRCSLRITGDSGLDDAVIPDPKRVNYGSQGGRVLITNLTDGSLRTAHIMPTTSDECKSMKYSVSLDIHQSKICMNKEKKSIQVDLERAKSIYQEFPEDKNERIEFSLLDVQNAKFVKRSGGLRDVDVFSLFSATNISLRWEPDVHIALVELGLQLKSMLHKHKPHGLDDKEKKDNEQKKEASPPLPSPPLPMKAEKPLKKREAVFAVDVELLSLSAEVGDGVETFIQVQSIFSENARIGVLFEGLLIDINEARVFRSGRTQISRVPNASASSSDGKSDKLTIWDWVIQSLNVHICLPFRLELRAVDDSVEDMLRVLKLVTSVKSRLLLPPKKEQSKPPRKSSTTKLGCVKLGIRKLVADIEEEPLQGWLDEHYKLLKNEAREVAVRLSFLDDIISRSSQNNGSSEQNGSFEGKTLYNGEEVDFQDASAVKKLREEIYKRSFQSYYQACQGIVPSQGSGACKKGFQSGFKFSSRRTSLFSICASELDCTVTKIEGGDAGMIEVVQKLDPVSRAHNIPFARLYGANINLHAGSIDALLRDYSYPLLATTSAQCKGRLVLAQQATVFQPQVHQEVYIGRWRKVDIFRSASGTTPPMKTFLDLPVHFQKGEVSFGVGYEPPFADISYAFTVALRRAHLCVRNPNPMVIPPKKEKSLPWWDEMRNYIHGHTTLYFSETKWHIFATTDLYDNVDKLTITTGYLELQQSDGRVFATSKDFKVFASSLEGLLKNCISKCPSDYSPPPFLEVPVLTLEVTMDWDCESGSPLNHYLFALPNEGVPREYLFDPFRSIALSLGFSISFEHSTASNDSQSQSFTIGNQAIQDGVSSSSLKSESTLSDSPVVNLGLHDIVWLKKFGSIQVIPPHKLRMFSRFKRFGIPLIPRSGNLSLDRIITEFMLRMDITPTCIRLIPIQEDDPAEGLTFKMTKVKSEVYFGRGMQEITFDCFRDPIVLLYLGLDFHLPKVYIDKEDCTTVTKIVQTTGESSQSASMGSVSDDKNNHDDGFLLSSDCFTIRKQSPKADPDKLLVWQESYGENPEMSDLRSEYENENPSRDHTKSEPSDDDGNNEVIADNCQRISVYGLKILWTLQIRDAVLSFVRGMSKACAASKPSPSRAYAQRKLHENNLDGSSDTQQNDNSDMPNNEPAILKNDSAEVLKNGNPDIQKKDGHDTQRNDAADMKKDDGIDMLKNEGQNHSVAEASRHVSSPSKSESVENHFPNMTAKSSNIDYSEEEGKHIFMVNVIEPQFNLHSEDANGRFLLAALSGRVLARSFHSVVHVGSEMIEQALSDDKIHISESQREMMWNRMEFTVMLEHVQAHVAPTDVDPGAGIQWLPKIRRSSPRVKRTGALLERVFMPCDMYLRFTRHNGGISDVKVKPLKELAFNSHDITVSMTSRQFQVMVDVLTNLLFARPPKPRRNCLTYSTEDDEDVEEEADEVVPDGIEEVELAKINLEQKERVQNLILGDMKNLPLLSDTSSDPQPETEMELWMMTCGRPMLVQNLKKDFQSSQKSVKDASASLRVALHEAAQQRLTEKEKNKGPSCAMRISLKINKMVWSMLVDGKSFAEAEINHMIYDYDRDYKDIGIAKFTIRFFVVRNCLPNAKSDTLLAPWNPPSEWGKKVMLRVDAKQGPRKEGLSTIELLQVDIYPLKIHLAESFYKVMWRYFFPEEEQDSQRRQEVWKVSTTGARRIKKGTAQEGSQDAETSKSSTSAFSVFGGANLSITNTESSKASKQNQKASSASGSKPGMRRTASFDKSWEETVAESVANELVMEMQSSIEQQDETAKNKGKDTKVAKTGGRPAQEDKKAAKVQDDKKTQPQRLREFHNIKISQVELSLTYEGSRFAVSDVRLLMDTFHRAEFTGTWSRLFSRVKKHIIWGVLKSMTGMQGKKFKDKSHDITVPEGLNLSDSDEGAEKTDQNPMGWAKRSDGAGDGFVTSVKGLFSSKRRKAKAFVLRTMRGETDNDQHPDWSENEAELSPFSRQLSVKKTKKLIRRHTRKLQARGSKGLSFDGEDSVPGSPMEITSFDTDSSSDSSPNEENA